MAARTRRSFGRGTIAGTSGCGAADRTPSWSDVASGLSAGTALDLGCGEGGDAVWLARQGWRVTAVDVSATALARATERAAAAGLADRIDFQRHDITRSFPVGAFDLVSAQYLQSPAAFRREPVLQAAVRAVTLGGLLLVVDHASVPPWSSADPETPFPTPEQILLSLDLAPPRWRVERLVRASREATGPTGETGPLIDNVVAVRRSGPRAGD